jgi:hypothetical protein
MKSKLTPIKQSKPDTRIGNKQRWIKWKLQKYLLG